MEFVLCIQRIIIEKLWLVMKQVKSLKKRFDSLLQNYQERLKESMKGSESMIDSVDLLQYKFRKFV